MITKLWVTMDGRRFESESEGHRHQECIELKALLLEAPLEEQAADRKDGPTGGFAERLAEWMLSDPTRTAILEILQVDNPDVPQPDHSAEGKTDRQRTIGPASGTAQGGIAGDTSRSLRTAEE